jgi:hypothetical protein
MKELLSIGEYNPYDDYPPLKVPLKDLFRFWWNHCVDKGLAVDEILDDIYVLCGALHKAYNAELIVMRTRAPWFPELHVISPE